MSKIERLLTAGKRQRMTDASNDNPCFLHYTHAEQTYFRKLSFDEQNDVSNIESAFSFLDETTQDVPVRFKIIRSGMDFKTKCFALKKLEHLENLDASSADYYKVWSHLEALISVPFGHYVRIEMESDVQEFIRGTRSRLDQDIYGHELAKGRIIRAIAQWMINPTTSGISVGICGGPGGGKTLLCKSIAKVLGLPLEFVSLGSASGEGSSYLVGHGHTYIGSKHGKVVECLINSKCMNPVIVMDELDKVSDTSRGTEIINALIHLTDSTQNNHFHDVYFSETSFDLSKCILLFTFNKIDNIDPVLLDRMSIINAPDYDINDKICIARSHMIPEVLRAYSFHSTDVVFSKDILTHMHSIIPTEGGVRALRRAIDDVVSHLNLARMLGDHKNKTGLVFPVHVDEEMVKEFVMVADGAKNYMSMYN